MSNLTITVDEEVLVRARIRALQQGTSVNAVLREYLEAYAGDDAARAARQRLVALSRRLTASSHGRRTWTRDELYDRPKRFNRTKR